MQVVKPVLSRTRMHRIDYLHSQDISLISLHYIFETNFFFLMKKEALRNLKSLLIKSDRHAKSNGRRRRLNLIQFSHKLHLFGFTIRTRKSSLSRDLASDQEILPEKLLKPFSRGKKREETFRRTPRSGWTEARLLICTIEPLNLNGRHASGAANAL